MSVEPTFRVSVFSEQGPRPYMEDECFVSTDGTFAAVFDGHGGHEVSKYLQKNIYPRLLQAASDEKCDNETALRKALLKVDEEVLEKKEWDCQGSTAVAIWIQDEEEEDVPTEASKSDEKQESDESTNDAIVLPSSGGRSIIAANIGDSRAVLCRNDTARDLTRDHSPNDPVERARIEGMGGVVSHYGENLYRVNGILAMSRAIGNGSERPIIIADPDMVRVEIDSEADRFIIIASDGLWDVMESQDAVSYVLKFLEQGQDRAGIATLVGKEALQRHSFDNVSVIIVWLDL